MTTTNLAQEYLMTRNAQSAPVSTGEFDDGPDTMLWNPHLEPSRWRKERLRAHTPHGVVLYGLFGIASLVLGIGWVDQPTAMMVMTVGVLALVAGVLAARVNAGCFTIDHRHTTTGRCRLEQQPGEFFYRTKDFTSLGTTTAEAVTFLVAAVGELETTPARSWLDPALPREAHLVVWDALSCLDRTRPARALAAQLATEPGENELATTAAAAIAQIDRSLAELVFHLRGCVTLTRAWVAKLHHADLATRTGASLLALREIPLSQVAIAAEALPQSVFAYLTAARDVTGAGPFPWEERAALPARFRDWTAAALRRLVRGRRGADETATPDGDS